MATSSAVLLAIVATFTDGGRESEVLSAIERAVAARPVLSLKALSRASRERVLRCGSEASCVAEVLRDEGVGLGLRAAVDLRSGAPLYTVRLIRADDGAVLADHFGEATNVNGLAAGIAGVTEEALDRAGLLPMTRLAIRTDPAGAAISVQPEAEVLNLGPGVYALPQGEYEVGASAPGHREQRIRIEARAAESRTATLVLSPESAAPSATWPWWIAVAIAAASVGGGLAIALSSSPGPVGSCVCVTAGAPCDCAPK